jgi:TolB-like protein
MRLRILPPMLIFCLLLIAMLKAPVIAADVGVKADITGQGGQRFPIAVSPLKNLGANTGDSARLSTGIADAMVHDLELSGWFKVLDRSAYLENSQTSGITLGTFDLKDWGTIGAEGLVKGGFSVQGDEVSVELRLFDVYQGKERIGKRYTGRVRDYRRIAHKFVDEIQYPNRLRVQQRRTFQGNFRLASRRQREISGHRQSYDQSVTRLESRRTFGVVFVVQRPRPDIVFVRALQRQRDPFHATRRRSIFERPVFARWPDDCGHP